MNRTDKKKLEKNKACICHISKYYINISVSILSVVINELYLKYIDLKSLTGVYEATG